jgi:hypothetical protein
MRKEGVRIIREYKMSLPVGPDEVFPLLCPVREYDWIPQWRCELVYSESGYAEPGCVFITDFDDGFGREVWVVTRYEPGAGISFCKTGEHCTCRYLISLSQDGEGTTAVWHQELTSLDTAGDDLLENYSEMSYITRMKMIEKMLEYYLINGVCLPEEKMRRMQ